MASRAALAVRRTTQRACSLAKLTVRSKHCELFEPSSVMATFTTAGGAEHHAKKRRKDDVSGTDSSSGAGASTSDTALPAAVLSRPVTAHGTFLRIITVSEHPAATLEATTRGGWHALSFASPGHMQMQLPEKECVPTVTHAKCSGVCSGVCKC
jgi:hypothetical protein